MSDEDKTADAWGDQRLLEALEAGKEVGAVQAKYAAVAIARRHGREADEKMGKALDDGNSDGVKMFAAQAQVAQRIAEEIEAS